MKNLYLLPTDKETRLFTSDSELILAGYPATTFKTGKNIYITDDEVIKERDWVIENITFQRPPYIGKTFYPKNDGTVTEEILKRDLLSVNYKGHYETLARNNNCKKIILTTDQDLIKDGVQAIDDEFLEWFVKNPSCEKVEVAELWKEGNPSTLDSYQVIIPKEEFTKET